MEATAIVSGSQVTVVCTKTEAVGTGRGEWIANRLTDWMQVWEKEEPWSPSCSRPEQPEHSCYF